MKYPDISSLTTKDLLSITLRENDSAVIDELTSRYRNLRELTEATISELTQIKGLGARKAQLLMASIELAKRLYSAPPDLSRSIKGPQDVADLVMGEMQYLDREHFRALLLNSKNRVIRVETISVGTLNTSMVHPRELFKTAIKHSAAGIILVHNHPSGDPTPSAQDIDITKRLIDAGKLLGIEVLDHVIIGNNSFRSFKEDGL